MRLVCIFSFFLSFFDYFLKKKKLTFLYFHRFKLNLYKYFYKNPPKINQSTKSLSSDIIISLTTIESRLNFLKYTLNSLISQTYKAKKIIVNYDDSIEHKRIENLIQIYKKFKVEFRLVENFGSHKKYLFLTKKERQHKIILCDDDMIYDKWFVETLQKISNLEYGSVITLFAKKMDDDQMNIKPMKFWSLQLKCCKKSNLYYWCGGAFTLYPNNFFDEKVLNKKFISSFFFNNEYKVIGYDDSWLNFNRIKKKIKVFYARPYSIFYWPAAKIDKHKNIRLGDIQNQGSDYWREENVFNRLLNSNQTIDL